MSENKKWKNWLIGILVIVAIGATAASVYFFSNREKCSDSKESVEKDCVENLSEPCQDCENYKTQLESIFDSFSNSEDFLFPSTCNDKYAYSTDFADKFYGSGIKLEEFSKDDLITATFYEIDNIPVCNNAKAPISLETINQALKEKFNSSSLEITLADLKNYNGSNLLFEFDGDIIYAWSNNCDGCGVGPQPYYVKHVESQELDGNNLYIYYRVANFVFLEESEDGLDFIYGAYDAADLEFSNIIGKSDEEITWSEYTLYKATYEIIDGEFYFRSNEIAEN